MFQIIVEVHGMTGSASGALIGNAVRRTFPEVKKVTANRVNGTVSFQSTEPVDTEKLRMAVDDTGYKFVACEVIEYERRSLFGKKMSSDDVG